MTDIIKKEDASSKVVAALGTGILVAVFTFANKHGMNVLLTAAVKSLPAQFLSWCIARDQVKRANLAKQRGIEDQEDARVDGDVVPLHQIKFQNTVATGLVFSAVADFCLAVEEHPEAGHRAWFLAGLVAFVVGRIFFTIALNRRIRDITRGRRVANTNNWALPLVAVLVVGLLALVVPSVTDTALQIGVLVFAAASGTMLLHSLYLTTCESNLLEYCEDKYEEMPAEVQGQFKGLYFRLVIRQLASPFLALQWHTPGALFLCTSDSLLCYSKFVLKDQNHFWVLSSYFASLLLFTLQAVSNLPCTRCVLEQYKLAPSADEIRDRILKSKE